MSLRHCGESSCLGRGVAHMCFGQPLPNGKGTEFVAAHPLPFGKGGFLLLKLGCEGSFGKKSEPLGFRETLEPARAQFGQRLELWQRVELGIRGKLAEPSRCADLEVGLCLKGG
ncbi:unnamed protein product [Prunus armeniaca]|uniref:Uncharacterized protein n=1 Tax=Prunus armeniaca TaxID=36596 RepID=A0A6J5TKC4_PRUAR|nr:unnamed protein product [Prunus armeniaca]